MAVARLSGKCAGKRRKLERKRMFMKYPSGIPLSHRLFSIVSLIVSFLFLLLAGTSSCMAAVQKEEVTVIDEASILMEEEADWLRETAKRLSEKSGFSVVVATCSDAKGKSAKEAAEGNFNAYAKGEDGISCLVDMDNREIYFTTAGKAMRYFSDAKIDEILDESYEAVLDEDYAQCLYLMLLRSEEAYEAGPNRNIGTVAGTAAAGVIAALIGFFGIWKRKRRKSYADPLVMGEKEARPMRRVRRYKRPMGNGRARTTRTRTGGRSFRGGGRRF